MAVPKVPTFDDFSWELVNLATGSFTNLDQSINNVAGWVGRGASRHRLESAHLEIIDGTVGAEALSWAGIQLLRIVPYADPTHELWGYIAKDKHRYTKTGLRDMIQVTVLPIEYLLHSRIVYETDNAAAAPVAIATEAAPNNTGGDFAKTLVTACTHGRYPTAAAADTRDWAWGVLFVAAQVHDGAAVAPPMTLFGGFLDEAIDALGQTYAFDWELYVAVVAGVVQFTFTTADAGGSDLTAGANRVIINDIGALIPAASRYFDREGMINALHGGATTTAVVDAASIVTWGRWEGEAQSSVDEELQLILDKSGIKEGSVFEFQASAASEQCQWMDEFEVGDTVKRNNIRLSIADSNEIIQAIEFSFKQRVLATRIRWGNKEQGDKEKTRQGRFTPFPPVPPTLWSRHAGSAYLYPTTLGDDVRLKDAAGIDKLTMDGATGSQTWADAAQMTWESIDYRMPQVAPVTGEALIATAGAPNLLSWGVPASSFWERGDIDATGAVVTGLFTRNAGDPVMVGADDSVEVANWQADAGYNTKFHVEGNIWVGRLVYSTTNSLALAGWHSGAVSIVHIYDPAGRISKLDVYNAAVRHHMFDADIASPSYIRGFFEMHDAAGAIGHSMNAVTGATILNEQGLGTGDVRWECTGNVNGMYLDATQGNAGFGRVPTEAHDVYRATGAVTSLVETGDASVVIFALTNSVQTWYLQNQPGGDFYLVDVTAGPTIPFIVRPGVPTLALEISPAEVVVNEASNDIDFRWESNGNTHMLFGDANALAGAGAVNIGGAAITQMFHVVGGDIDVDTGNGYRVNNTAGNRHVLIGNGTRGVFRALVAADLGGHVHVNTFGAVATGAGTAHTHVMAGNTAAGTAHNHAYNNVVNYHAAGYDGDVNTGNWTAYGAITYTLAITDSGGTPRYVYIADNAAGLNARWQYMYVPTRPHLHYVSYDSAATGDENAHTHGIGTIAAANENAHTHLYDKTATPTQGPS